MIVAATGLLREADIVRGSGMTVAVGAGRPAQLRSQLEALIARGAQGIMSFGIAGALAMALKPGDCIVASEIVTDSRRYLTDPAWTARIRVGLPDTVSAPLASGDAICLSAAEKATLFRKTQAYAVDTESHIAAQLAERYRLPFAALRAISDPAQSDLPPLAITAIAPDGRVNLGAVFRSLLTRPSQIAALLRTARDSNKAFAALIRCRDLLGIGMLGPDCGEVALDVR